MHCPFSRASGRSRKKKSRQESGGGRGLRGLCFPRHIEPVVFRAQGTLKVGFLSNLQVAGWLFWEPSLLMSTFNVRLTSDHVKCKPCIYNNLRQAAYAQPGARITSAWDGKSLNLVVHVVS